MERQGLVGIVVVSHSNKLAQEAINFVEMLKMDKFEIINGGNIEKEIMGTTVESIVEGIKKANSGSGVLVFVDMGSSIFNAGKAKKELEGIIQVEIADAPLIEGLISAVAANSEEVTLKELKKIAEDSKSSNKIRK